jgi:hypothetical protein
MEQGATADKARTISRRKTPHHEHFCGSAPLSRQSIPAHVSHLSTGNALSRFPPPWTVDEYRGISFIVRDANKFAVAYVYFENEPGRHEVAILIKHGHWPNVRFLGEPDTPGWRE